MIQSLPAFCRELTTRLRAVVPDLPAPAAGEVRTLAVAIDCRPIETAAGFLAVANRLEQTAHGYGGQLKKELRLELLALASRCRQVAAQLPNLPAWKEAVS